MLTIGISWLYITLLCGGMGWVAVEIAGRCIKQRSDVVPLSLLPFLGLSLISAGTAIISLLAPVCWQWNLLFIALLGLGMALLGIERLSHFRLRCLAALSGWPSLFLVFCGSILLLKSACVVGLYGTGESVFHSDTGYYHAQSIRWIEEYGVVPGLGNLLSPLAIDYLWFQPCALFSFAAFLPQRIHAMGGLLVFWAMLYATGGVIGLTARRFSDLSFSDLYRALLLIPLFEIGNYIVSDSGDEPAAVMVLVSIGAAMNFLTTGRGLPSLIRRELLGEGSPLLLYASCLLLLFAVGIKLSLLPLLLLIMLLTIPLVRARQWKKFMSVVLLCGCILVPKVIRTAILSGYLVYPFASLDLLNVDWKMPSSVLVSEKAAVESMARIRFAKPGVALNGGMDVWFFPWLAKFIHAPLVVLLFVSLLTFLAGLFYFGKPLLLGVKPFWKIYLTVSIGLVYWFVMAPDVRFGFGFLATASLLLCLPVFGQALAGTSSLSEGGIFIRPFLSLLGLVFVLGLLFSAPKPMPGDSFGRGVVFSQYYPLRIIRMIEGREPADFLVYQNPYPLPEMLHLRLGNLQINRPKRGMHCWDANIPATPYLYSRVEMRGDTLKQGFRTFVGPIDGFSGFRLVEEWQQAQRKSEESKEDQKH